MQLEPLQSIAVLFALLALVGAGVYLRWAKRERTLREIGEEAAAAYQEPPLHHVMDGRTAVARQLCGQAHCWNPRAMAYFDQCSTYREPWLAEADRQIENRNRNVPA